MSLEEEEYFAAIPWCNGYLQNPSLTRISGISRRSNGTTYDTLFSETFKTVNTLPAILSLQKTPFERNRVTETITFISLGSGMNGYVDSLHGGAIAAILDEVAGLMVRLGDQPGGDPHFPIVTAYLHVNYLKPVRTPQVVQVKAKIAFVERRKKKIDVQMCDQDDQVLATGEALFVRMKENHS